MNVIKEALVDEEWFVTGSTSFLGEGEDVDVCVKANSLDLAHKFLLRCRKTWESLSGDYEIPLSWGGRTFIRFEVEVDDLKYDIFVVDEKSFNVIRKTTRIMKNWAKNDGLEVLKDKDLRIEIFQSVAKSLFREKKDG